VRAAHQCSGPSGFVTAGKPGHGNHGRGAREAGLRSVQRQRAGGVRLEVRAVRTEHRASSRCVRGVKTANLHAARTAPSWPLPRSRRDARAGQRTGRTPAETCQLPRGSSRRDVAGGRPGSTGPGLARPGFAMAPPAARQFRLTSPGRFPGAVVPALAGDGAGGRPQEVSGSPGVNAGS
jgi:hypothetical protein